MLLNNRQTFRNKIPKTWIVKTFKWIVKTCGILKYVWCPVQFPLTLEANQTLWKKKNEEEDQIRDIQPKMEFNKGNACLRTFTDKEFC